MKIQRWTGTDYEGFQFYCPGCGYPHDVCTRAPAGERPVWSFNGDDERPTLSPSVLVRKPDPGDWNRNISVCHLFLRDGQLQYLNDCTHELAGQTVPLPEIPESWR